MHLQARQDAKLATGGGGGGRKSKTASALSEKKPLFVEVLYMYVRTYVRTCMYIYMYA